MNNNLREEIEIVLGYWLHSKANEVDSILFHEEYEDFVKALTSLIQQEREKALREFVAWWGKQSLGTSIHLNNVEQFLKESEGK